MMDQVNQTQPGNDQQVQKQYSTPTLFRVARRKTKQAANKVGSFFMMGYDKKGRKELSNQLGAQAAKSNNQITKNVSKWVNPKNAVIGTAVGLGLASASFKPWGWGENAVKKSLGAVDKNAFAYEKQQNQTVQ
jgi:hypothetical protein